MAEQDFAAIMRKYNSLIGDQSARIDGNEQNLSPSSATQSALLNKELDQIFSASTADQYMEDRFIRAPVAAPSQTQPQPGDEGYEHVMFNSLFASVDATDAFNRDKVANREAFFRQNELAFDLLAADFARRLYQYELDLRQQYDPSMGMYPTQALYAPKPTKLKWAAPKEKKLKKEMDETKKPSSKPLTDKGSSSKPPKAQEAHIHRKSETEKSKEDEEEKELEEESKDSQDS
jgi:hypothetical protein